MYQLYKKLYASNVTKWKNVVDKEKKLKKATERQIYGELMQKLEQDLYFKDNASPFLEYLRGYDFILKIDSINRQSIYLKAEPLGFGYKEMEGGYGPMTRVIANISF